MRIRRWRSKFALMGLWMALCCVPAGAAIFDLDFETDPQELGVQFFGTSQWRDFNGVEDSGYLSVTDAVDSQRGAIVFPDLTNGEALNAFAIDAWLRVGGGENPPADGFSFNFVRPGDPVLDDGEGWAASPTNEANLPEEGTTTGLGIGFDEWFSGGIDVVGMSIRIDNQLVNQVAFPTANGLLEDETSLQTHVEPYFGAVNPEDLQEFMGWAPLSIRLCANNLTVTYKDVEVFNEVAEYDPSPGRLVFGGRTGDNNAYHHIDDVSIRTNEDVGAGCVVIPPSFVAGQGTIGTRTYDAVQSNEVIGPQQSGTPGWSAKLVDTDLTVDNHTIAEIVLDDEDGVVSTGWLPDPDDQVPYPAVDLSGGFGTFPADYAYPNGIDNETMEDFAVRVEADVVIPVGTWTIGFASDDGGQLTIPGVEFEQWLNNDSGEDNQIRFENNRGHDWTVGSFTLTEPLETTIMASFHERGGGDSFEIAVIEGEVIEAASPDTGWELLTDGTFDWSVTTTGTPLLSADLNAAIVLERPLEFDVDGDTGAADMVLIENPNPAVFTTILDVDNVTFQIAPVGTLTDGESFQIVSADRILGTPTITSLVPGQTWTFDPGTGFLTFGIGGLRGDYNGNGQLDAEDLDWQAEVGLSLRPFESKFDENNDGVVNELDRGIWLDDLKETWVGDANLDFEFNTADFVQVFTEGKYETGERAGWAQGDWTGDLIFDTADFVAAFTANGYERGPYPGEGVAAVPEPSTIVLSLFGLISLLGLARRR